MSQVFDQNNGPGVRVLAVLLAMLSLLALGVTVWILFDVQREMEIVERLVKHLPLSDMERAGELSGTLRLQHRLSMLLALNTVATAVAFVVVVRAYLSSEQSLRDAKTLATDIRASMDKAIITTDDYGKITSINPKGHELLELSEEWVGRPLADISASHRMLEAIRTDVSANHTSIRDREYRVRDHGHTRVLRAGCTLLRNQRGDEIGTVVHVSDITEKALMEDRLRRMERYMGLGALAAGLQHEIKNPLSALSLHIQLLREQLARAPIRNAGEVTTQTMGDCALGTASSPNADARHPIAAPSESSERGEVECLLDVLRDEVHRINKVLDSFGSYASMEKLGRTPVDFQVLVDKLARLLRPQATQHNITISIQLPNRTLPSIQADSVRIEQVLLNLALNALAAMPHGGQLVFRLDQCDDMLEIVVSDTGHGVPTEIQGQIFDPYFTTQHDGTGMGLALCEKIVRQHAGAIDFKTGPNGTAFRILLPLDSSDDA